MGRHVSDWIENYVILMQNTEPAALFDRWVAYSVVAAALRRKAFLQLGRLLYFPNLYVVLVAEPGVARKTQAIKYGVDFIKTIPEIRISPDSTTKEALGDDIEAANMPELLTDGTQLVHCSLNIISKEFESFLGDKKNNNTKLIVALTDLFDCPDDWSSRTRHGVSNKIINPWLNLIAATTPDSLANCLPASAVGGGLTSRIMFIWAERKKCSVAIPEMTAPERKLQEQLERDLYQISRISGEYKMTPDCVAKWENWYQNYDEDESGIRICKDKSFSGWYSRKPTYLMKLAIIRAASESNTMEIHWRHVERELEEILQAEKVMGNAFKAIGRSEVSGDVDTILRLVEQHKVISERTLMNIVWRDMDAAKFVNVTETAVKTGRIARSFKGPLGETNGVWFIATGIDA